jgi:hypothetical protein
LGESVAIAGSIIAKPEGGERVIFHGKLAG